MTFRPDTPLGGPGLRRFSDSIADMFRRILPFPLKLFRVATADQPTAADYEGAIDYDSTVSRPAYSDGSSWTSLMPYTAGEALTRVSDTNVTLTLGGTPATALLKATSITVGWSGQLAASRGGTGVSSLGDITRVDDTNVTLTLGGTPTGAVITSTSFTLGWTGTLAASRGGTGVGSLGDITKVDDTNVTLTLGGTPVGAVITSTSFTLGWSGTLAVSRGGTGAATAEDARTNLGLGTAAVKDTGTSGDAVPLLDGANTWGADQTFSSNLFTFGPASGGAPVIVAQGDSAVFRCTDTGATGTSIGTIGYSFRGSNGVTVASILRVSGSANLVYENSSNHVFTVGGTTGLTVSATAVSPASATTASAANVFQSGTGTALLRSTSSERYKQNIAPLPEGQADKVLDLESIVYRSRAAADDPQRTFWGFTAEQAHTVLPALVTYDAQGAPDGFQYERVIVGLVSVVKRERAARLALEARVRNLEIGRPR